MQSTASSMFGGSTWTSICRCAGNVQSSAVTVIAVLVVGVTESRFFRRSGRSAGMSVAVYLRTRGLRARARSPVPALFFQVEKVREGMASVRRGFEGTHPSSRICA